MNTSTLPRFLTPLFRQPFLIIGLAFLAGILITLSLAPYKIWPASLLGLGILFFILEHSDMRQAFWRGWAFASGMLLSGISWVYVSIHVYGYQPVWVAAILTFLFCTGIALTVALSFLLYRRLAPSHSGLRALLFPGAWVLGEWLRSWMLTGMPWLYVGYGHVDGPLKSLAPVIGVFGLSFFVAWSAAALVRALLGSNLRSSLRMAWVASAALPFALASSVASIDWIDPTGETVTVALVQANIAQEDKWKPSKIPGHIRLQQEMSKPHWGKDLLIWPEAAVPRLYQRAGPLLGSMQAKAKLSGTTFITGIPFRQQANEEFDRAHNHNSLVTLGKTESIYHKRRLVPFGEYVPFRDLLASLLEVFALPMSDFKPGPAGQALPTANGLILAPYICYEAVYPSLMYPEADLLLTISNDTWFGNSIGPLQHLQMAQMRALEYGRAMLRGTNNGVSALIDADGSILAQTDQFEQTVLTGKVRLYQGQTPYTHIGSQGIVLVIFLFSLLLIVGGYFRRP